MHNLDIGQNQNIGIGDHAVQEDVVRSEMIETAAGLKLTVGLICDGESPDNQSPEVFQQLAEMIIRNLEKAEGNDVGQIMSDSLTQTHLALRNKNGGEANGFVASVTLVVIQQKRLFLAHSGSTRAYLVRGDTAVQLTQDHIHNGKLTAGLGINPDLKLSLRPVPDRPFPLDPTQNSLPLKAGDALVLCSDGLVKERPDHRGALLDATTEIPRVLNDTKVSAVEAARTLVSLAVGRRADDNVSALVIRLPKKSRGTLVAALVLVGIVALVAVFMVLRMMDPGPAETVTSTETAVANITTLEPTLTTEASPTPEEVEVESGYASVQIRGSIGEFAYIPQGGTAAEAIMPATSIEVDDQVFTGADSRLQLILNDGTQLFLGPDTELYFAAISPVAVSASETTPLPTKLVLKQGDLLLWQTETSGLITVEAEDSVVVLEATGMLAAARANSELTVYCFAGSCRWDGAALAPGQLGIRPLPSEDIPAISSITAEVRAEWNDLCACLDEE